MDINSEALCTIIGIIAHPAYEILKMKFTDNNTTIEKLAFDICQKNPEAVHKFINALADNRRSETEYFNRDIVSGSAPSQWVVDARAGIRPVVTIISLVALLTEMVFNMNMDAGTRSTLCLIVSSWFGSRIILKK